MGYVDALHVAKDAQFPPDLKTTFFQETGLVGGELGGICRVDCYLSPIN